MGRGPHFPESQAVKVGWVIAGGSQAILVLKEAGQCSVYPPIVAGFDVPFGKAQ